MTIRIGAATLDYIEAKAVTVDIWYNKHIRLWEVTKRDAYGNQVGDTVYAYGKALALQYKSEMEEEIND